MEPGGGALPLGDPLAPITIHGSMPSLCAQDPPSHTPLNCTLQSPSSQSVRGELGCDGSLATGDGEGDLQGLLAKMGPGGSAGDSQGLLAKMGPGGSDLLANVGPGGNAGDSRDLLANVGPGGGAQRSSRPSAFPSSLAWDSDSEKETLDEEDLQHFSNPHGLAAHSPGTPAASGHEQDRPVGEDYQAPGKLKHLFLDKDPSSIVQGRDQGGVSTHRTEPKTTLSSSPQLKEDKVGNVPEEAELFLPEAKPKEGCRKEEEGKGDKQKGKEKSSPERDVYTFPGDSDPDSPPPAPWAHCTFIQRKRKKRALLRPFSGLGIWHCTATGAGRKARAAASRAKERVKAMNDSRVFEFEEEVEEEEEVVVEEEEDDYEEEEEEEVREEEEKKKAQEPRGELCQEIFTCVECSIYFKRRAHLKEHMREHCQKGGAGRNGQRGEGTGGRRCKRGTLECTECGVELRDRLALVDHHRRHQESRRKILEEIGKLNKGGKGASERGRCGEATEPAATALAPACGQFVCLKCNFSSDVPQELADHAKTHPPRERSGLLRSSPRFQPKLCPVDQAQASGSGALCPAAPLPSEHYPTRASRQAGASELRSAAQSSQLNVCATEGRKEMDSGPGSSHDFPVSTQSLADPSDEPAMLAPPTGTASPAVAAEDNSPQPQSHLPQTPDPQAGLQRRDVAFKSIGNCRPTRGTRERTGRTRSCSRPDPQSSETSDLQNQMQKTDQASEENQKQPEPLPELKLGSNMDPVDVPTLAMQLKRSFSAGLRGAAESLGLTGGQQAQLSRTLPLVLIEPLCSDPQTPLSYSKVVDDSTRMTPTNTLDLKASCSLKKNSVKQEEQKEEANTDRKVKSDDDDDDDDDDGEEDEEEVVKRLLEEDLSDEDEDEDGEAGMIKSVERKCPYCSDRFHNGIGLANHVRGHLNRVGVSYNVRHFISPEEVNAIEKKFSYQKKKKKVANFDPSTFSVMRCEFCSAGFDTRAGLSSHARAHLRDFGITNWEVTVSPINILRELFSSRPDLVLPTAPPSTPPSGQDSDDEEEEEPGPADRKGDGVGDAKPPPQLSESTPQAWKKELEGSEPEGGEEEDQMPVLDSLTGSPAGKGVFTLGPESPNPRDETDTKAPSLLQCEVCGAPFETRRGLSSHARSHLRQLGVGMSESSGAPIDLLYQITKERAALDGRFPPAPARAPKKPPRKEAECEEEVPLDVKPPVALSVLADAVKVSPSPPAPSPTGSLPPSPFASSRSPSPSPPPVLRKAPISSLLPASSPLRSLEHKAGTAKTPSALSAPKPFWAPQETDAPLNLTVQVDPGKDIVCRLCGAWFETRKGLSSHARAHLRHFGVEYSEAKGSPIDLLNRLILTDDFKHRAGILPSDDHAVGLASIAHTSSPHSKRPPLSSPLLYKATAVGGGAGPKATSAPLLGPPSKRPKPSPLQVFRLTGGELTPFPQAEPLKDVGCEFCGEYFENRKGLSSHARSHLRQMGITEWSVNGSPIDTLREIIVRRGLPCALPPRPLKSPPSSPGPGPPRAPLSSHHSPAGLLGRLPFPFTHPPSHQQLTARKMAASASATSTTPTAVMVKPKPEPVQLEVTMSGGAMGVGGGYTAESLHRSWSGVDGVHPINFAVVHDVEPTRDIRCEFCGEYFENRKGLSSHARSHLRQMGVTEWSVNGSPIDTLREIMRKQGASPASAAVGVKKEPGHGGSPTWEGLGYQSPKFSRKSPLNLLHSGSRLHRHGLGGGGLSTTPPAGKLFGVSPLGKRPLLEDGRLAERSPPPQLKTFSPPPHDFSFKGKSSPDKHGVGHLDASCELCGFYFENRKALASHARAHLRQFGVTEWCVNGSPIETLSAWMRSRPQKAAEMHRSYLQGSRAFHKKKCSSSLSPSSDSDPTSPVSQKPSSSQWASLGLPSGRAVGSREVAGGPWGSSSSSSSPRTAEGKAGTNPSSRHGLGPARSTHHASSSLSPQRSTHHYANSSHPHAQVARSELNVRLPRGFERRPLKHPSHADSGERESGPPKSARTSTVPALVPRPPSTPLVKLVGKIYSLKCRFCEVEFHGPLSVQEDWIRHLQQHILNLNYGKPASTTTATPASTEAGTPAKPAAPAPPPPASATTSASTTATARTPTRTRTPTLTPAPTPTEAPTAPPTAPAPATAEPTPAPAT